MGFFLSVVGKMIKSLLKWLLKSDATALVEKLEQELAVRLLKVFTKEEAERVVRELGEEFVKELVKELGEHRLKELVDSFGSTTLSELVDEIGTPNLKKVGVDALQKIGTFLTPNSLADFINELGTDQVKELAEKFGGDIMKHYGHAFFKSYKGATNNTLNHLLGNDGVIRGEIKGCHDAATFVDELVTQGRGQILSTTSHHTNLDVVLYQYKLYQRNRDLSLKLDASPDSFHW